MHSQKQSFSSASSPRQRKRKPWAREPPSYRGLGRYLRFIGPREPGYWWQQQHNRTAKPDRRPAPPPRSRKSPSLRAAALELVHAAGSDRISGAAEGEMQSSAFPHDEKEEGDEEPAQPAASMPQSVHDDDDDDDDSLAEDATDSADQWDSKGIRVAAQEVLEAASAAQAAARIGQMGWNQRGPLDEGNSRLPFLSLRRSSNSSKITTKTSSSLDPMEQAHNADAQRSQRVPLPSYLQEELADWELEHVPDLSPFLHSIPTQQLCYMQRLSFMSAAAYAIDSMRRLHVLEKMGMQLVQTSIDPSDEQDERVTQGTSIAQDVDDSSFHNVDDVNSEAAKDGEGQMYDSNMCAEAVNAAIPFVDDENVNGVVLLNGLAEARDQNDADSKQEDSQHDKHEHGWFSLPSLPWFPHGKEKGDEAHNLTHSSSSENLADEHAAGDSSAAKLAQEAMDIDKEQLADEGNSIVTGLASWAQPLASRTASGKNQSGYSFLQAVAPLTRAAAAGSATASQALAATVRPLAEATRGGGIAAPAALAGLVSSAATATQGGMNREFAQADSSSRKQKPKYECPCSWYVANQSATSSRYFVIEGTNSVATWQVNVQFDPVQFEAEELDLNIHRGVYEAAESLYDTVLAHVEQQARSSTIAATPSFVLTGHSLGGCLALVLTMMISWRRPDLRWVLSRPYCFGSPSVISDNKVNEDGTVSSPWRNRTAPLERVGLPGSFAVCVNMHLDLVPRAFSCDYTLVRNVLSGWGDMFGRHACLQDVSCSSLYGPCGISVILQPDVQYAEQHPYLPLGSGVYEVRDPTSKELQKQTRPLQQHLKHAVGSLFSTLQQGSRRSEREATLSHQARTTKSMEKQAEEERRMFGTDPINDPDEEATEDVTEGLHEAADDVEAERDEEDIRDACEALYAIVNTPHPLEILSDWRAYGPSGGVSRYHNPFSYSRALAYELRKRRASVAVRTLPRSFI